MKLSDRFEMVHISKIKNGDTIEHNGGFLTVCNNDIKRSELMGVTIFGDSYNLGTKKVKRMIVRT
ncbi:hypothetical protein phiP47_048 [Plesiomonas phage phiP4-7]|nr:hypothetical protein phiP47_048 [Plesiomonas phage phiP4-7]